MSTRRKLVTVLTAATLAAGFAPAAADAGGIRWNHANPCSAHRGIIAPPPVGVCWGNVWVHPGWGPVVPW